MSDLTEDLRVVLDRVFDHTLPTNTWDPLRRVREALSHPDARLVPGGEHWLGGDHSNQTRQAGAE